MMLQNFGCGGMESDEDKKKLNDDVALFMSSRSDAEAPRYAPRLQKYADLQQKLVPPSAVNNYFIKDHSKYTT